MRAPHGARPRGGERPLERGNAEPKRADTAELVATKGDEHELRHLAELRQAHGDALVEIATGPRHADLVRAAGETRRAMEAGAPVIFQATFLRDGWRGHSDFLERADRPSDLGDWSYEVADTKLDRSVYFVIQLCGRKPRLLIRKDLHT